MESKISKYFCIFCESCPLFPTLTEAYNHYKLHMKVEYFCVDCDNNRKCSQTHSKDKKTSAGSGTESEEGLVEMWIERFLSYQSEIIEKTYSQLFRSTKLFNGCAVCQTFLRLLNQNGIKWGKGSIMWSLNQSFANETRHVCSHLRYYPFECYKCEKVGRYHKKCDMSEISRHIKDSHSVCLKDTNFESLVKSVKIRKLENFIEYNFQNRNLNPNQYQTNQASGSDTTANEKNAAEKALPSSPTPALSPRPTRNAKRIANESLKSPVIIREPKPKRARIETKFIADTNDSRNMNNNNNNNKSNDNKNTLICSQKSDLVLSLKKPHFSNKIIDINIKEKNVIKSNAEKVDNCKTTAKVEIKFKPIVKTYGNAMNSSTSFGPKPKQNNLISGDQIIIKKVPELSTKAVSLLNKSAPNLTVKPVIQRINNISLSQQFSDMMDDEDRQEMQAMNMTPTAGVLKNIDYFCLFCSQTFAVKESAYEHIQRHLDYYPIVCLTCGEGITDLQSFMRHHRELHPQAVKGRYKKKEQPIVDKWISSFLYSQTTFVRSFPPRETCPICDRVFSRPDIQKNKPRRCTINRKIDHLYRHLSYLPYECILCKQSGQEFLVAYFESKAHSHIKLKHPQIDDNDSRWHIFQKTISIPKLDEFIDNYLSKFGISMQFERRPVKKSVKYSSPDSEMFNTFNANSDSLEVSNSSLNLNMIFSDLIDSSDSPKIDSNTSHNTCVNKTIKANIDLVTIDDNMDSDLMHEYNNNSNDSNIVVNVSPLTLFDKSVSDSSEEDLYFCIFCSQSQYLSKIEAYSHYGQHLDYLPVLCKICSNNFSDVDHLMAHHQSEHSTQTNVDYEIREDQILVKWVNEFLESQLTAKKVMPCSCRYNCPVCVKLIGDGLADSPSPSPCAQHNDVIFSVHIHKHLNYFPYECMTCKRNDRSVRVPNLDSMAMTHLKEHKIENASMTQVVKSFPKTLVIPRLEKLIGDCVHRKRVSEKKNRLDLNQLSALYPTVATTANSYPLLTIALDSEPSTSTSTSNSSQNTLTNKTHHIRLEGGRVVNLPPKTAVQESPKIVNKSNGKELETNGSNDSQTNAHNICHICCVNCRQYFPNKKLFKIHHNQAHPGKPILCSKNIS